MGRLSNVAYEVDGCLITLRCRGRYSIDTLVEVIDKLLSSAEHPRWRVLLDARASDSLLTRSTDELREISEFITKRSSKVERVAILVDGLLRYGLMRMASSWVNHLIDVQVFREMDQAHAWLTRTDRRAESVVSQPP